MYKQIGGNVLPSEYFGRNSRRYFPIGSKELIPGNHSCGKTNAVSFPNTDLGPIPNHTGVQTGGHVLPSEYFGRNSGRYFAPGSKQLVPGNHSCGKTNAVSFPHTNLGPIPNHTGVQTGGLWFFDNLLKTKRPNNTKKNKKNTKKQKGGNNYLYINNPATNRNVSITSKKGQEILKGYINEIKSDAGIF